MPIGIRTRDLRKVYTSPPPMAATGSMFRGPKKKKDGKKDGKKFEVTALDGVSLEVHPGEIFGLLGPNGAGKSTTVGILTTRIRPTSGEAWIGNHEVWREQVETKKLIGVVQQKPNLDFALTAREILELRCILRYFLKRTRTTCYGVAGTVSIDRPRRRDCARLFRRHDAAPLHRTRHDARSPGPVPRRAQHGPRSADALVALGYYSRLPETGKNHSPHHPQHGGGGRALPAHRHHRSWQGDRPGDAGGIENFHSRRLPVACAFQRNARRSCAAFERTSRCERSKNPGHKRGPLC